jgi:beta-lactamase class A
MNNRPVVAGLLALALLPLAASSQTAGDPGLARLQGELERLTPLSGGTMGVGVLHLESGAELFVNGDEPFPMASTFKVPVAVRLLTMVEGGGLRLDSLITVQESDLHPGSGEISHLLDDPGVVLSVRNLMELMLLISDNSATDILLRTAGGGAAVNARLAELGIRGISVDRPTIELIADFVGVKGLPPEGERTPAAYRALQRGLTDADRTAAREAFLKDTRDTATPRGMTRLLSAVWKRQALAEAGSALLLDIMFRCETSPTRLKGMLPQGTRVAHKTGTLTPGVSADVGIIELPGDAGHVVVAAFIKGSTVDAATQDRAIAHVARTVHDYFTLRPGARP